MKSFAYAILAVIGLCLPATAWATLFDFDNAPYRSMLPISLTVEGIKADLSFTGDPKGFSIQRADALGFTPAGFSGLCIYPDSVFPADLHIAFTPALTDFSILYAPEEYGSDASAIMRVTAYMRGALVGTNTAQADPPGTWPSATLGFSSAQPFDSVVVHWEKAPAGSENWGPIFMADNMNVTAAPEPSMVTMLALGTVAVLRHRRKA